jgi:hypothetical protein
MVGFCIEIEIGIGIEIAPVIPVAGLISGARYPGRFFGTSSPVHQCTSAEIPTPFSIVVVVVIDATNGQERPRELYPSASVPCAPA